ncbi:Shedu anti-phage system protein SduA domain-containing protein [Nocardia wallacei]|uniref:Shedu anti-phage system protein SduA domain-containing protein n=1 Tax=Nocardia wallacei TaxID=480035 RepID=UPI0024574DA4|nr:Shedu anti-phage system protein SduA domain-containing protein [Nocardia wallacei]
MSSIDPTDPRPYSHLSDYLVTHGSIQAAAIKEYDEALDAAPNEAAMQKFLEEHPRFLTQLLRGGGDRWVIPTKRLGSEHVTDFLIADQDSAGLVWYAVELERPQAKLFTTKGDPTSALTHAVRQINDWRSWLSRNRDYASRSQTESGLGLQDIDPELDGIIVIGRRTEQARDIDDRLRRLARDHRLTICTFDWLAETARQTLPPPNPMADFLLSFRSEKRVSEQAVQEVFGSIGSATSFVSAARTVDWESVEIADGVDALFYIVRTYRKHPPELGLYDWNDWQSWIIENGVSENNMNFMVSEQEPSSELREKLEVNADGVWSLQEKGRWPQLSVLAFIPRDLELDIAKKRAEVARELFIRYWNSRSTAQEFE